MDALEAAVLPERELMSLLNPAPDAAGLVAEPPEADASAGAVDTGSGADSAA